VAQAETDQERKDKAERDKRGRREWEKREWVEWEKQTKADQERKDKAERDKRERAEREKQTKAEQEQKDKAERDKRERAEREKQTKARQKRKGKAEQERISDRLETIRQEKDRNSRNHYGTQELNTDYSSTRTPELKFGTTTPKVRKVKKNRHSITILQIRDHYLAKLIANPNPNDPIKDAPDVHKHFTRYSKGPFEGPVFKISRTKSKITLRASHEYEDLLLRFAL